MANILVVDDERTNRAFIDNALRHRHDVKGVESAELALFTLREDPVDLVIADVHLPSMSGMSLLRRLSREQSDVAVILTSDASSVDDAVEAMQLDARDFLVRPLDPSKVQKAVEEALEARKPEPSEEDTEPVGRVFDGIVGRSRPMSNLKKLIQQVSSTDTTVLLTGETGTGKELIGQAIHRASMRSEEQFCAVNSAAFTESLLESELFGYQRGAFTGATANKKGIFEYADGGTVLLDEAAEMPPSMQAKLLRFLQSGEVRPVGAQTSRFVDLRLIAATNKDLEREVEEGRFREDLYYRLAVIPVHIPALRERREDVPDLAHHFVSVFSGPQKQIEGIDPDAMESMCSYDWPGNVRELENAIERGVALCKRSWIGLDDLPPRIRQQGALCSESENIDSLNVVERRHILKTLEKVNWNRSQAAQLLQISTTTLWRRLKEFGVESGTRPRAGRSLTHL
jgi:DNA-binding NtrC family response regulator